MHNPKLSMRLPRVKVPTLFLWGENDGVTPPELGLAYSHLIPGARFSTIAEAGHYPHLEQPDAVLKQVISFLE